MGESHDSLSSASSPTDRACNLRRSANLGSNVQGSISDSSPACLLGALHRADLLLLTLRRGASIIIPSPGLPWVAINHAHLNLSAWPRSFLFHRIHNDRRKRFSVYPPPGAPSPDYGALAAALLPLASFLPRAKPRITPGNYNEITAHNGLQAVVLLPILITGIKSATAKATSAA